jgi:short-subunit dehydrogenase
MRSVLVVGATSAIAEAVVREFAARGDALFLAARDTAKLGSIADDLRVRGAAAVHTAPLDVTDAASRAAALAAADAAIGTPDIALVAHGTLPDQRACEGSEADLVEALDVNFVATVAMVSAIANRMQAAGRGTIAVITSVAGDRGRASNYVYGAAKAGVSTFLSGLRHRLHRHGIAVADVRPGFVDTPMTASIAKNPLFASPSAVARDIVAAIDRGTPVRYTPWFWRPIMLVVRLLPRALFHRTGL